MLTELCVAVSSYASNGRWEHQQFSSGNGITRTWEGGNVAEMARTCLHVCAVRVVDSFRNNTFLFERMEDVGIGHFVIGSMAEQESPVVDVLSTYNIANMI